MRALWTAAVLALLLTACGVGGGTGGGLGGGDRLSSEQCQELLDKIDEIITRGLSAEEKEMSRLTPEGQAETLRSCVDGETWGPKGYECVMRATTNSQLQNCIRVDR